MIEIKEFYSPEHPSSVFIMFDREFNVHWCSSGNVLRQIYLELPDKWLSGPIEVAIPEYLSKKIFEAMDNY